MTLFVVPLILIILLVISKTDNYTLKGKEDEWQLKKNQELIEEISEMRRLNLDWESYRIHKLHELNNRFSILIKDNLKFPNLISIHKDGYNKKQLLTYDEDNGYKKWDETDSKLIF